MLPIFQKNSIHPTIVSFKSNNQENLCVMVVSCYLCFASGIRKASILQAPTVYCIPVYGSNLNYLQLPLRYHGLESLVDTGQVRVKRFYRNHSGIVENGITDEPCKYDINTESGQGLFYAIERTECFARHANLFVKPPCLQFDLMNMTGEQVLRIDIQPGFSGYAWGATIKQKERVVGTVTEQKGCFTPFYWLQDCRSGETLTVRVHNQQEDCFIFPITSLKGWTSALYDIVGSDGHTRLGRITKQYTSAPIMSCDHCVSFLEDVPSTVKILLICTALLMDVSEHPERIDPARRRMNFAQFCAQVTIASVLNAIVILLIVLFFVYVLRV